MNSPLLCTVHLHVIPMVIDFLMVHELLMQNVCRRLKGEIYSPCRKPI